MNHTAYRSAARQLMGGLGALAVMATLSGCAMGTLNLSGPEAVSGQMNLQGKAFGGEQPVSGATVQVYQVGTSGYGSGATALGSSTTTDPNGFFNLTGKYTCPSSTTQVYVVATGGNPGAGTNSALRFVAPFGNCSNLSSASYVWINEVTTAATAYALTQYSTTSTSGLSASDSIGSPNTTQAELGLANAFLTALSLVNTTNGTAATSTSLTGAGSTLTAVPEYQQLYLIADILASCVNSNNGSTSPCQQTLFPDVTPAGGTAPTDIYQAAVMMNLNPALNVSSLFGLQTSTSPYVANAQTTQPTDFTLGIQYQDNVGTFFLKPQNIAVDGYGNVWVLSQNSGLGGLVELGPTGTPLANVSTLHEEGPLAASSYAANTTVALTSPKDTTTTMNFIDYTFTTSFGQASNNPAITPRNISIDPSNNVWFTQTSGVSSTTGDGVSGSSGNATSEPTSGAVFEVATSLGTPTGSTYGFSTGKSAYALDVDGSGDVYIGEQSSSAYFAEYEFPYSSTAGAALQQPVTYTESGGTTGSSGTTGTEIAEEYVAMDKSGNQWFTTGVSGTTVNKLAVPAVTPTAGSLTQSTDTYTTVTLGSGTGTPFGVAEGSNGMWVASSSGTPGVNLIPFGSTTATLYGSSTTFNAPNYLAVDGLGNVWAPDHTGPGTASTTGGGISEVSSSGTILSPSNGGSSTLSVGYTHMGLTYGAGVAVDPSGDVWVANNAAFSSACSNPLTTTTNTCSSVFEIVGAAAPVVTPIAAYQTTGAVRP